MSQEEDECIRMLKEMAGNFPLNQLHVPLVINQDSGLSLLIVCGFRTSDLPGVDCYLQEQRRGNEQGDKEKLPYKKLIVRV